MTADELYSQIKNMFNDIGLKLEPGELSLKKNATDYSIKILKNVGFKIKKGNRDHFLIRKIPGYNLPDRYKVDSLKSFPLYHRVWLVFDEDLSDLKKYLLQMYISALPDDDVFGCCNEFKVCSDNMACLKNLKFSARCMYKVNLEAGRIFYGINRNI